LGAASLVGCAHGGSQTSAQPETAAAEQAPPPAESAQAPAPEQQPQMQQASAETSAQGGCIKQSASAQPCPTGQKGEAFLQQKGTFEQPTGSTERQEGKVFKPEGTYGTMGTIGVKEVQGVKGSYGTYYKPESRFSRPDSVTVNEQGRYIQPFGSAPQALGEGGLNEKQPVAGHDVTPGFFIVQAPSGRRYQLDNKSMIKQAEEKMKAAGVDPGPIDGVADQQFGTALVKFQAQQGLPATGVIDQKTSQALGLDWSKLRLNMHEPQGGQQPSGAQQPSDQQPQQ
jgi:hypothetical protein